MSLDLTSGASRVPTESDGLLDQHAGLEGALVGQRWGDGSFSLDTPQWLKPTVCAGTPHTAFPGHLCRKPGRCLVREP